MTNLMPRSRPHVRASSAYKASDRNPSGVRFANVGRASRALFGPRSHLTLARHPCPMTITPSHRVSCGSSPNTRSTLESCREGTPPFLAPRPSSSHPFCSVGLGADTQAWPLTSSVSTETRTHARTTQGAIKLPTPMPDARGSTSDPHPHSEGYPRVWGSRSREAAGNANTCQHTYAHQPSFPRMPGAPAMHRYGPHRIVARRRTVGVRNGRSSPTQCRPRLPPPPIRQSVWNTRLEIDSHPGILVVISLHQLFRELHGAY
ncbi:hypothetical protein V8D89_013160 [Ganoderma adspersum]